MLTFISVYVAIVKTNASPRNLQNRQFFRGNPLCGT